MTLKNHLQPPASSKTFSEQAWVHFRTSFLISVPGRNLRQHPFSTDLPGRKRVPGGSWLRLSGPSPQVWAVYFTQTLRLSRVTVFTYSGTETTQRVPQVKGQRNKWAWPESHLCLHPVVPPHQGRFIRGSPLISTRFYLHVEMFRQICFNYLRTNEAWVFRL